MTCLFVACEPSSDSRDYSPVTAVDASTSPSRHDSLMDELHKTPQEPIKEIGVLVYDGVNDLDFTGPYYILSQLMGTNIQLIGRNAGPIKTVGGMEVIPHTSMQAVEHLDILLIPGGFKGTIAAAYDQELQDWIRKMDQHTVYTASVCTGAWILASTGLLAGKNATTNWYRAEEMLAKYGAVFQSDRYVRDGKYWTSAGVTAGMDMALAMIKEIRGEAYAQAVMLDLEYDPAPPIEGGTPEKTSTAVYQMMLALYDSGTKPLLDSLERSQLK